MKKTLLSIACLFGSLITTAQTPAASLNFDGIDDYVSVNSTSLLSMTDAITIEAWVKTTGSPTVEQYITSKSDNSFYMALNVGGNVGKASFYINGVSSSWLFSNASNITDNNWHHVAATYDGTTIKIYIDGLFDNSAAATGTIQTGGNNVDFGCRNNNQFLQGSIDEARIWNIARTQCEINTYMNCEIPGSATGLVANYHFNQGYDAFDNTSETSLMDASGNSNTGTLTNLTLTGTTSNWIASGGVVSGFSTPTVCPVASALNFDGVNDIVSIPTVTMLSNLGLAPFTLESWVYPTNSTAVKSIIRKDGDYNLYLNGGVLMAEVWPAGGSGGAFTQFNSGTTVALNQWSHVAAVWNGTSMKLYVNGNATTTSTIASSSGSTSNLNIGRSFNFSEPFVGNLDEIRIWNTARTQCEINTYMNAEIPTSATGLVANYHFNQGYDAFDNSSETSLMDASGNSNTGTLTNLTLTGTTSNWIAPGAVVNGFSTPTVCPVASALNFDGVNDYVEIGNVIPSGSSYTKEMWVYALDNGCNNLLSSGDDPFYLSSGRLAAGNNGNYNYVQDGTNFPLNTWVHAAVTYDALTSTMVLYVNGIMVASGNSAGPYSGAPTTYIGRHTGGCYFSGQLDEVRVWNVARTQCEINTYMNAEIPTSATGLVANYHFNQGYDAFDNSSETSLMDASGNSNTGTLTNLTLTGTTSNWIAPGAVVNDYTISLAPPTISVNSGSICSGDSFTITASGADNYIYSGGSDVVMPTSDATYTVTGTNTLTTCSNVAVSTVTVNELPTITVNSGTICAGQSFTITPGGADTYTYSGGSDVVMPTGDATYSVSGTDANGCVSNVDAISTVSVNALPTITVNNGTICAGQSFTIIPSGADTYTYSGGNDVVMPTGDATYSVSGTDANGCVSNVDAVSTVSVNALPSLMAITNNTLLCAGETATLSVTGNATTYTWSTTETAMDIAVSPTATAIYTVEGTDDNGCINSTTISQDVSLCTGLSMVAEALEATLRLYPNPNNGLFVIDLNTNSQVSITNALGQIVFNETLSFGKQNLNIQNQADGIYFVKVTQQDKQHIIKLIKK